MQKKIYLTPEGLEKLRAELEELRTTARREIAERIREAKEYGDLSENSEYEDVKNQQAFIEGHIAELEHAIRNATVITSTKSDVVAIGSTVILKSSKGSEVYTIVGTQEADPGNGKISFESPIGKALIGRKKGEKVEITVPAGTVEYTVMDIK